VVFQSLRTGNRDAARGQGEIAGVGPGTESVDRRLSAADAPASWRSWREVIERYEAASDLAAGGARQ